MVRQVHPDMMMGGIGGIGAAGPRSSNSGIKIGQPLPAYKPKKKARVTSSGVKVGQPIPAYRPRKKETAPKPVVRKTQPRNEAPRKSSRKVEPEQPRSVTKSISNDNPGSRIASVTEEPKAPEPMSLEDWYMQDSSYISAEAAARAARDQALAGYGRDKNSTNQGFGDGLRNLGRRWEDKNNNGYADDDELAASSWDSANPMGAYGQAHKNTQDDFTGRGLLDSSFYVNALTDLDNSFDSQYGDMSTARQTALSEILAQEEASKSDYNNAIAGERANSAQRRALKYQL